MENDLNLMLDNAKRYNDPKSTLYKDACKLKKITKETSKELHDLMEKQKLHASNKSREKKLKLLQEIAELSGEELDQVVHHTEEAQNLEELEDDDENESEDEENLSEEEELETSKSKKSINLNSTDEIELETSKTNRRSKNNSKLITSMWSLFDYIKDLKHSNQSLIDPFLKLPSKRLYPDYYEEIKNPIAMNIIKKRLNKRLYKSFKDFNNDLELIFQNAMQYNLEESVIYSNAKRLLEGLKQKSSEITTNNPDILIQSSPQQQATPTRKSLKLKQQQQQNASEAPVQIKPLSKLPKFADYKEKMIYLYNYINDFQIEDRELAPPFRHLPSRTDYPDYYNIIKKPIDLSKIWNKINHLQNSYANLDDMCADMALMFENACIYNEPTSTLYKDALNLQRALFLRRDEILTNESSDLNEQECLAADFVQNQVQELIETLFDCCMQHQDLEGRVLSESFLDLYNLFDLELKETNIDSIEPIKTFNLIQNRIKNRVYTRIDLFQDEIFEVFNQIRIKSYFDLTKYQKHQIHRYSQLYKDAYELQRYFIQKRDELCRNGELLQSGALAYKLTSLDSYLSSFMGTSVNHFDEAEALLVEQQFKPLEIKLDQTKTSKNTSLVFSIGNFYYLNRNLIKKALNLEVNSNNENLIVCILAQNQNKSQIIVQVYLKQSDEEFFDLNLVKTRRFFSQEVFKSDLYALIDLDQVNEMLPCLVIGFKEYLTSEANFSKPPESTIDVCLKKEDIFVCESIYSTRFHYFRRLVNKKWSPLQFINANSQLNPLVYNFTFTKRPSPLVLERNYPNEDYIQELYKNIDSKLEEINSKSSIFKHFYRETIQFDSAPSNLVSKDADEMEATQIEVEDPELMKTAKYYEQLVYKPNDILYKLGDFVYVKYQQIDAAIHQMADPDTRAPLIVRIDRMYSIQNESTISYFVRGPVFLRPADIPHEPTRLFYRNEVFKEVTRELTVNMEQIIGTKKCVVMNPKKYCTSRPTEINEQDVFVCETKYSLQNKVFRKFTKCLRKFELSVKCSEDEVYFMRKELVLRRHLSPFLIDLKINYQDTGTDYLKNFNDPNILAEGEETEWKDDENSSQSMTEHMDTTQTVNPSTPIVNSSAKAVFLNENSNSQSSKKVRVKRMKKTGFNLFSKDFRKSLRDTQSSLSFTDMSKEVGMRWKALSDKERAAYEERAIIETAKEAEKRAAEEAASKQQQQISANIPIIKQQAPPVIVYQQQQQQQTPAPVPATVVQTNQTTIQQTVYNNLEQQVKQPAQETAKQVLHKEAYVRYIANMKKQQQFFQSAAWNNPGANVSIITHSDWYNGLDVRMNRFKENKVQLPPTAWIENCSSNQVLQNLISLRYYLLNDAITIQKDQLETDELEMMQTDAEDSENTESNTLTVL